MTASIPLSPLPRGRRHPRVRSQGGTQGPPDAFPAITGHGRRPIHRVDLRSHRVGERPKDRLLGCTAHARSPDPLAGRRAPSPRRRRAGGPRRRRGGEVKPPPSPSPRPAGGGRGQAVGQDPSSHPSLPWTRDPLRCQRRKGQAAMPASRSHPGCPGGREAPGPPAVSPSRRDPDPSARRGGGAVGALVPPSLGRPSPPIVATGWGGGRGDPVGRVHGAGSRPVSHAPPPDGRPSLRDGGPGEAEAPRRLEGVGGTRATRAPVRVPTAVAPPQGRWTHGRPGATGAFARDAQYRDAAASHPPRRGRVGPPVPPPAGR